MQPPADAGRAWLQELLYFMMVGKQYDYCFTFHNINTVATNKPFAFFGMQPIMAAISMSKKTDQLSLCVYYPAFSKLSKQAQIVVLQHEAMHIIEGHFSSYGIKLRDAYGPEVTNLAMDVYINQQLDVKAVEDCGFMMATCEALDLPKGLSSAEYCELIKQKMDSGGMPRPKTKVCIVVPKGTLGGIPETSRNPINRDDLEVELVEEGDAGEPDGEKQNSGAGPAEYVPIEVFDFSEEDIEAINTAVKSVINNVKSVMRDGNYQQSRGFGGADQQSFFAASERQATVPWFQYLRMMETKMRNDIVVATRHRLSRRNEYHLGRVRRQGLDVIFMIDTSGSMDEQQLRLVDPELRGIHARGAHISVIHCDAAVAKVEQYNPFNQLTEFCGRGGTDYSDALLFLRTMPSMPSLFIGYTDGYGGIEQYKEQIINERGNAWWEDYVMHAPTRSPDGVETLWLVPEGCMAPDEFKKNIVPWGTIVVVPTDKANERT